MQSSPNFKRQLGQIRYRVTSGYKYHQLGRRLPYSKKNIIGLIAACLIVIAFIVVGVIYWLPEREEGAVVTNGIECSKIGMDILRKGGSAADSAIAALFCEGITCPQSMGLGGGFLLTIYIKSTGIAETLNARETAPAAATPDMFLTESSVTGGKAVAVPGELKGYWALHQRYGKLAWAELVEPTIELCQNGHIVSGYLARILRNTEAKILAEPTLRDVFIDPTTNRTWLEGDRIKRTKLAETLKVVRDEGVNALYGNGSLLPNFIKDIQDYGGIITEQDMLDYKVRWESPATTHLKSVGLTVYSSPPPGSGDILNFILNLLDGFYPDASDKNSPTMWQRVVESFKYAYAERTQLGDYHFELDAAATMERLRSTEFTTKVRNEINDKQTYQDYLHYGANFSGAEDHGTAHISVLAPNGDSVAVTSTINYILGAMFSSPSTGIILNNEMDDFAVPGVNNSYGIPPSPVNYIIPGKRPMSSMCPTIIVNEMGFTRIIIGAAGGAKITTSVASVLFRHFWLKESLFDAVNAKRLHHQLAPMTLQNEAEFDQNILTELKSYGHVLQEITPDSGFAALTAISKYNERLTAMYDPRRSGGFELL